MSDGHYVCCVCHKFIRKGRGERAIRAEQKTYADSKGNIHTYYTMKHANPITCAERSRE